MNTLSHTQTQETFEHTSQSQGQREQTLPEAVATHSDPDTPYISVSGVASMAERVVLTEVLRNELNEEEVNALKLIAGIQASTISQVLGVPTKRGDNWMPVRDDIWEPFSGARNSYGMIESESYTVDQVKSAVGLSAAYMHFNPDHKFLTPRSLEFQLQGIFERDPGHSRQVSFAMNAASIDGLQLNRLGLEFLSNPDLIRSIQDLYVDQSTFVKKQSVPLIFQIGSTVLNTCSAYWLREAIEGSIIDTVLIDSSGGNGQSFDRENYARIIADIQPFAKIAVAGGLGPEDLEDFEWLVDRFGPLSVDAESKLRDWAITDHHSSSRFNPYKAADFVIGALEVNMRV